MEQMEQIKKSTTGVKATWCVIIGIVVGLIVGFLIWGSAVSGQRAGLARRVIVTTYWDASTSVCNLFIHGELVVTRTDGLELTKNVPVCTVTAQQAGISGGVIHCAPVQAKDADQCGFIGSGPDIVVRF